MLIFFSLVQAAQANPLKSRRIEIMREPRCSPYDTVLNLRDITWSSGFTGILRAVEKFPPLTALYLVCHKLQLAPTFTHTQYGDYLIV